MPLTIATQQPTTGKFWEEQSNSERLSNLYMRAQAMIDMASHDNEEWRPFIYDGYNYMYDNPMADVHTKDGFQRVFDNQIWPQMTQELGFVAGQRPEIHARPDANSPPENSKIWEKSLRWYFHKWLKVPRLRLQASMSAKITGNYVVRVFWDPEAEWDEDNQEWDGRVGATLLRIDRGEWLCDPDATCLKDARFVGTTREMAVLDAIARWPEYEEQIKEGAGRTSGPKPDADEDQLNIILYQKDRAELDGEAKKAGHDHGPWAYHEGDLTAVLLGRSRIGVEREKQLKKTGAFSEDQQSEEPEYVVITELFFRDYSKKQSNNDVAMSDESDLAAAGIVKRRDGKWGFAARLDDNGDPAIVPDDEFPTVKDDKEIPKFPYGRRVLMAGDIILNREEDKQRWNRKRWPFALGHNYMLLHTWHGLNSVLMAKSAQDLVNLTLTHQCEYLKKYSDPQLWIEEGAIANDSALRKVGKWFSARSGVIIRLAEGGLNKIKRVDPASMSPALNSLNDRFSQALRDITGQQEISVGKSSSGEQTATEAASLASNSRVRVAMLQSFLDDWTVELMELVADEMHANHKEGDMVPVLGDEMAQGFEQLQKNNMNAKYHLKLQVGTALPYDEERDQAKAVQLFSLIGPPYMPRLLEAFRVDNKEELLRKIQAWDMIQQVIAQDEAEGDDATNLRDLLQGAQAPVVGEAGTHEETEQEEEIVG